MWDVEIGVVPGRSNLDCLCKVWHGMHLYLHLAHASMSCLVALLADSLFDCTCGSVLLFCATFSMGLGLVYSSSRLAIHNSTRKKCRSDPGSLEEIPNYVSYLPVLIVQRHNKHFHELRIKDDLTKPRHAAYVSDDAALRCYVDYDAVSVRLSGSNAILTGWQLYMLMTLVALGALESIWWISPLGLTSVARIDIQDLSIAERLDSQGRQRHEVDRHDPRHFAMLQ